jgi:hypothetical protein
MNNRLGDFRHFRYILPLVVAAITRVCSAVFIDISSINWKFAKPDILMEYGVIARNMLGGHGYSYSWIRASGDTVILPTAYMPPGQVFVDYFSLLIFGDNVTGVIGVFIVNIIVGVLSVYVVGKITQEIFVNNRIEKVALWAAALYPPFIYSTASFGVTTAVIFLHAFIILNVLRLSNNSRVKYAIYAGIGFGLLHLFRGEAPIFLAVTTLFLLVKHGSQLLPRIGMMVVVAMTVLTPWTIRNAITLERFVPISSNGGFNFWRGNNGHTMSTLGSSDYSPIWTTDELFASAQQYLDSGVVYDKIHSSLYMNDALTWIWGNPIEAATGWMIKGVILWSVYPAELPFEMFVYLCFYTPLLICFIFGIAYCIKDRAMSNAGVRLLLTWCLTATILSMAFFPSARHQIILSGIFFPIAVFGLYHVYMSVTKQRIS